MKLRELKYVINTDLTLHDMTNNEFYTNVNVFASTFHHFRNYTVVSIRDHTSCTHVDKGIVISIR